MAPRFMSIRSGVPHPERSNEGIMSHIPVGSPAFPGYLTHPGSIPPPPYGYARPTAHPCPAGVWQAIAASTAVVLVVITHLWALSRLAHSFALLADLIAIVVVMVWTYRARTNAEAYTTSEFRRASGWAIGGWVCPIVNLWFPLQVMKDIWAASDTDRPDSFAIKAWAVTAVIPLWWTCVIGSALGQISSSIYNDASTASETHAWLILDYAGVAVDIAAAVMFIFIVGTVTRFQSERHENARAAWHENGQLA